MSHDVNVNVDAPATVPRAAAPVPAPDDAAASGRRAVLLLALFGALAVAMTFPRVDRIGTHVVGDNGDALLNLWTLDWVWHAWREGWTVLWDGQAFQPASDTLAYSEAMIPAALLFGVIRLVVRSDAAAFTLVGLLAWTSSQWWAYRLLRRFTATDAPAVLGAVAWTFSAVRLGQLLHFQLTAGCLVPLVVLCTVRFLEVPTARRGLAVGGALGVLTLSASYYGLMAVVATGVVLAIGFAWRWSSLGWGAVARLVPGALLAAALVGPVAIQYVDLQRDPHFRREPEHQFAASREDFLATAGGNRFLVDVPLVEPPANVERSLFPGVVTTVLAAAGVGVLAVDLRRRRSRRAGAPPAGMPPSPPDPTSAVPRGRHRLELGAVVAAGIVLLVLSAGDRIAIAGHHVAMPYHLLRTLVPPFDGVRGTARFAVSWQLALSALAVVGAGALVARFGARRGAWVCAVLGVVVLLESAVEVPLVRLPDADAWTAVDHALDERPDGLVVELPVSQQAALATWAWVEAPRQYLARIDDHPRVNGYSGFEPPGFGLTASTLNTFPSPAALALADELGVRYVVIRTDTVGWFPPELEAALDIDGVGRWDPDLVADRLAALDPARVASVEQVGAAWLLELTPPTGS
jgi:hypothetical protein